MLLENIFGTKTKVRILTALATANAPRKRNQIVYECGGSIQGIYDQIEELIGIGVVKEENGKILLEENFPFYEEIVNLVLRTKEYIWSPKSVFSRIDQLLGDNYYIGGFWAARQKTVPIDYETNAVLLQILGTNKKIKKRLEALSKVSGMEFRIREIQRIPEDVGKREIFGVEVWVASVERGIVEAFQFVDCSEYGAYLVLVQNLVERTIRKEKLMEISVMYGMKEMLLGVLCTINEISEKRLIALTNEEKKNARIVDEHGRKAIRDAINTVIG
ncbi:MAG: hypothetical protein QXU48_05805 [Thermoplasmata archaeon]